MAEKREFGGLLDDPSREHIAYIKQILAELAQVARREKAEMLAYLLEMAFTEASDLLNSQSEAARIQGNRTQGHQAARMAVKPARKI